jgi:excinuclease ABC subunit C
MTKKEIKKLPDKPGVYFFKKGKENIYIGKATSIKDRVSSYFSKDLIETRGPLIVQMVEEADDVSFLETDSVLEAIIQEANLIKKFQPRYNTKEKDNKSFSYLVITKEDFPIVKTVRGRELFSKKKNDYRNIFGPYPSTPVLKKSLKITRKVFTFRDEKCGPDRNKPCFNRQINLCPGVCTGEISKRDYLRNIRNIELFFSGKKGKLIKDLERQMKKYSDEMQFEKAQEVKKTIFSLQHINDISLIKSGLYSSGGEVSKESIRIEGYDIAHISGKHMVGVMVVVENGLIKKSDYRKFKIRNQDTPDDTKALNEILERRFAHPEWGIPDIIVLDGGVAQRNVGKGFMEKYGLESKVVSVVKDEKHRPKLILGNIEEHEAEILLANSEAHRFAIKYHRSLRKY